MASINPYAEEKEHVLFVYDAPTAFQIHFCFTIKSLAKWLVRSGRQSLSTHKHVNSPHSPTYNPIHSQTDTLVNSLTCQLVNLKKYQLFSKKFNIKSALFLHQPRTLPQKIDSREGLFWCKIGLVCEWCKMNIYSKGTPFTPIFGLFSAKYRAIWG